MLKKLLIYVLIGTALTTVPLCYVNNILLADGGTLRKKTSTRGLFDFKKFGAEVPNEARYIAVTFEGDYVTYIDEGKLYIKDGKSNKVFDVVEEDSPIIYSLPLSDRNIIMYFTYNNENLVIKTYDLNKQEKTEHKSIKVSHLENIKDVRYSNYTNVIYINAEINKYGTVRSNIYRVDIMKNVSIYAWSKEIENMELLNNKDTLVYEDSDNRIHIKSKIFRYENNRKFKLLGVDSNDNIYLLSLDNPNTMFIVKNGEVVNQRILEDSNYEGIFNRDNKVCLLYKDHVYDVVHDKKIDIKPNAAIVDINDGHIVYKNDENKILIEKI